MQRLHRLLPIITPNGFLDLIRVRHGVVPMSMIPGCGEIMKIILEPETKYESPWGWGLTLGKSFNYDYGNIFSFDLRGRYLRGRWYGQNSMMDSISMDNFDPTINVNDASAHQLAQLYQNNYGGYYHNYEADIHRIALELVLHFNRFREKTRIDPYIFGGVGLTFKKSMGDFLDVNGNLYDETTLMNHESRFRL